MQEKHALSPEQGRASRDTESTRRYAKRFRLTLTVRGRVVGPDAEALLFLMKTSPGQLLSKTTLARSEFIAFYAA